MTPNNNKNNNKNKEQQKQINQLSAQLKQMTKAAAKSMRPIVKKSLLSAGKAIGGYAGSQIGMPILGEQAGEKVFAMLSKAIGSGDYEVMGARANSLISGNSRRKDDGFHFIHREYIKDITAAGTGGFSLDAVDINPGISDSFPYLAQIASNFEEFRINGMIFEFISTASNYSNTVSLGTIIAAAEYNTSATPFTTKIQMENANNAVAARTDRNILFGIECDEFPNARYYVKTPTASSTPINLTTPATFYLGQVLPTTIAAGTIVGELWVSYDITFFRPRPAQAGTLDTTSFAHYPYKFNTVNLSAGRDVTMSDVYNGALLNRVVGLDCSLTPAGIRLTAATNDVFNIYVSLARFPGAGSLETTAAGGDVYLTGDVQKWSILTGSTGARTDSIDEDPAVSIANLTDKAIYTSIRFLADTTIIINPFVQSNGSSARFTYSTTNNTAALGGDIFIHYMGNSTKKTDY